MTFEVLNRLSLDADRLPGTSPEAQEGPGKRAAPAEAPDVEATASDAVQARPDARTAASTVPAALPAATAGEPYDTSVDATIARIRVALRRRSGKAWSVKRDRGTAYGWITINAPPARCTWNWEGTGPQDPRYDVGCPSLADRQELARLLGLPGAVHSQGVSIPAASDYRQEFIDRAEGRTPTTYGQPYWD